MRTHNGESKKHKSYEVEWATAIYWGRRIHINKRTFDSYLLDCGYLERASGDGQLNREAGEDAVKFYNRELQLTPKGLAHVRLEKGMLGLRILWDFDTYIEVARRRAESADIHDICPRCKAFLDTVPGYNHLDYSHRCSKCGAVCEVWEVSVNFDR